MAQLDEFIIAAAAVLGLPLEEAWRPEVRANLEVILRHAERATAFELPDDAEPAPVFEA